MKKWLMFLMLVAAIVALLTVTASAAKTGDLFYDVNSDNTITISECVVSATGDLVVPDTIDGYPVTRIRDGAFQLCKNLTSVTIPDSVTSLGGGLFYGCRNLKEVILPKTTHSLDQAIEGGEGAAGGIDYYGFFEGCSSLETITIPNTVTEIGYLAFSDCSSLRKITIPKSVTEIGSSAFSGCSSLTKLAIPVGVTSIGSYAFCDCTSLAAINIPGSVKTVGEWAFKDTAYYNDASNWVNGLLYLDDVLIDSSQSITEADVAAGTRLIADSAFNSAYSKNEKLRRITIPSSVTSIGDGAFERCASLIDITIPNSVTSVGGGLFYGCSNLKTVHLPENLDALQSKWFGSRYAYGSYAYGFFEGCSSLTDVTIPDSVTRIGEEAFRGCSSLTDVTIPDSVTRIGEEAFRGCSSLKSITIPDSVTETGGAVFYGCSNLKTVHLPKNLDALRYHRTDNGDYITITGFFEGCSSLTNVTIPNSVTSIGGNAFQGCSSLTKITIPNGVTSIGGSAFQECSSLKSITIPDSVTETGSAVFYGCSNLESVTLSKNMTALPYQWSGSYYDDDYYDDEYYEYHPNDYNGFFENCTSLKTINLPDGITRISESTFESCSSLTSVNIPKSVTEISEAAFLGCSNLRDVYYKGTAKQWADVSVDSNNESVLNATIHYNYAPFAITTQPVAVSTVAGKTAVFKVAAAGTDLTYQWQYKAPNGSWKNSPADGNRTATLKVPATVSRDGYQYRCMVKCGDETRYSKAAKLTVFGIKTQPTSVSSKVDKAVSFSVVATGPNLTYQWQYKTPNGKWTNSPATGNQTATLSVPVTMSRNGYQYRCVVKSGNNTVNSKAATLTVFGIKTQPKNVSTTAGKNVTMKVAATGKNLTYQWQYKTPSGDWKNSVGEGNQTNTLTIKATTGRHNYQFRCVVKSGSEKIISKAAKLTVFGIKTQPKNVSATIGKTATFKVVATGSNLTYQWQYRKPGGSWKSSTMDSAKSATLKIPATAGRNNYQFRCIVKSGSSKITTNVVKLTAFGIKTQPKNVTAAKGGTATFKVVAVGSNLTYQWQYKAPGGSWKNSVGTGNQTAALKVPATNGRNGYQFRCIVKSGSLSVTSSVVKLTVKK